MEPLKKVLESAKAKGYRIIDKGRITGESGVEHTFDVMLIGSKGKSYALTFLEKLGFEHVIPLLAFRNHYKIPHIVFTLEIEPGVEKLLKNSNIIVMHLKDFSVAYDHPEIKDEEILQAFLRMLEEVG
jgi:hypothetical protein